MHARLLGIRLLTLDARVVVANDVDTKADGLAVPDRLTLVAPDPDAVPVERSGDVATARELLAEGADTLARTASKRSLSQVVPPVTCHQSPSARGGDQPGGDSDQRPARGDATG